MFFISVPKTDDLESGTEVRINGSPTVLKREGDFLIYTDDEGRANRCRIVAVEKVDRLPMRDGSVVEGLSFTCLSHGQDGADCVLMTMEAK